MVITPFPEGMLTYKFQKSVLVYLPKYHHFSWNELDLKTYKHGSLVFGNTCWLSSYWCLLFGCYFKIAPCIMVLSVGWWCSNAWVFKVGEHPHFYVSSSITIWVCSPHCNLLAAFSQNLWVPDHFVSEYISLMSTLNLLYENTRRYGSLRAAYFCGGLVAFGHLEGPSGPL